MPSTRPAAVTPAHPHQADMPTEKCPWCGQQITRRRFREIEERIKTEERQKRARFEAHLREQFEQEERIRAGKTQADIQRIKDKAHAEIEAEKKKAAEREAVARAEARQAGREDLKEEVAAAHREKLAAENAKEAAERAHQETLRREQVKAQKDHQRLEEQLLQLKKEKDESAAQVEEEKKRAAEREAAIRRESHEAAQTEFRDRIAAVEKEKAETEKAKKLADRTHAEALRLEREESLKSQQELAVKLAQLETEKQEVAAAAEEATRQAADRVSAARLEERAAAEKSAKDEQEALRLQYLEDVQKQREILEKEKEASLNQEKAKAFADRQKLESKIGELQRQVQAQSAAELGEGAEVDLFESLRNEFPDDTIIRIGKGEAGADIRHEVMYQGQLSGRIVYDSKNRKRWSRDYATKLRVDQLAAEADHALLAASKLPAGEHQICVREGVIVANPARAAVLVGILREHIILAHRLRLSGEDRQSKTAELYDFMNSDKCEQLLRRGQEVAADLMELDVKEQREHSRTWEKRGALVRALEKANRDFRSEVGRIMAS